VSVDLDEGLKVVAAAVRMPEGLIVSLAQPARHHHIIHTLCHAVPFRSDGKPEYQVACTQGFLLSNGEFAVRAYARIVADKAGQLLPGARKHNDLFSEDVW